MSHKIISRVATLGILLLVQTQTIAHAETVYEEGVRLYKAGELEKAGGCLEAEIKTHPTNANARYLLGNVFLGLHRNDEAGRQYQEALRIAPAGPEAQYCKQGLAGIARGASSASAAAGAASAQSQIDQSEASSIRNSATAISKQTDESESHMSVECEAKIRDITRDSERRINGLEKEMQEKIDANGQAVAVRVYSRFRTQSRVVNTYDPSQDNEAIRADYERQMSAVRQDQANKISEVKVAFKQRQTAAEDAAMTLDKAYVSGSAAGNVKLRPQGTDLHVRTYETADEPSGNAVPMAASPSKTLSTSKKSSQ